jgi:hypothetical protein
MRLKRRKLFHTAVLPARGAMRWWYDKKLGRPRAGRGAIALPQALAGSLDVVVKGQKPRGANAAQLDLFAK